MAEDDIPPKPPAQEIAPARDSDEFIGLWAKGIREPTDPILRGRGGDLRFYDQVRTDAQVWSTFQQRVAAVASRPWEVRPGAEDPASEEAAERLTEELKRLDLDAIFRRMHWGVFYGYSVAEIMWGAEGGRWTFDAIRVRRARRFGFDVDGNLMIRAALNRSEERMPEGKFWVMTTSADTEDEPYGLGLAHLLYWPAYFKRAGMKSWMIALDKYASPTAKGTFPPGTTAEDQAKLLAGLRAIRQDSALIHPEGMEVEYLQTAKSASLDYQAFDRRMDAWIAKIVLSQTMTTDDGSSRSQSEVHMEVRDEVAVADADLLCGSFNRGPARWWTAWNFGERAAPPQLVRIIEDEEDQDAAADRDVKLLQVGWRPTAERIERVYGADYEPVPPPATPPPPPGSTGEEEEETPELADAEEPDAVAAFAEALLAAGATENAVADLLAPILEAAEGAGSYEAYREALGALSLADAPLAPLRELMAQAMFAARLGGEVGADLREGVESETP